MIQFRWNRRESETHTPIIRDSDIQGYAQAIINEYNPELLKRPSAINPVHFVEKYFNATVDYQDIYCKEKGQTILGATAFNEEKLPVYDREKHCVKNIDLHPNTIVLNSDLTQLGNEPIANFTVLHEAGHLFLHREVYEQNRMVCCRKSTVGIDVKPVGDWTEEDFREHQANIFAAEILMPSRVFIAYARKLIQFYGNKDGIMIEKESYLDDEDPGMVSGIIQHLSIVYGVTTAAVTVQLHRYHLLMKPEDYCEFKKAV